MPFGSQSSQTVCGCGAGDGRWLLGPWQGSRRNRLALGMASLPQWDTGPRDEGPSRSVTRELPRKGRAVPEVVAGLHQTTDCALDARRTGPFLQPMAWPYRRLAGSVDVDPRTGTVSSPGPLNIHRPEFKARSPPRKPGKQTRLVTGRGYVLTLLVPALSANLFSA